MLYGKPRVRDVEKYPQELISPGDYNEKLSAMSLTVWLGSYVDLGLY